MTQVEIVRAKIKRLRHVTGLLHGCLPARPDALAADEDVLHLVAFRVYLGLQEALDVASHVIADEGWGPAASLREHFELLARHGVLQPALAQSLADGVKVRNLIGHAYGDVDPAKLHAAATILPALLGDFCAQVLGFAEGVAARG
ncbi:MAG: DUF86 domain-containing protein [Deltaproteobacteria bacterium]|nr:DUF86 domain-containing protein [Deltaproteobacteria bacterium]